MRIPFTDIHIGPSFHGHSQGYNNHHNQGYTDYGYGHNHAPSYNGHMPGHLMHHGHGYMAMHDLHGAYNGAKNAFHHIFHHWFYTCLIFMLSSIYIS